LTNQEFREFLAAKLPEFSRARTLAFLAITNNSVDVPRKGSSVVAAKFDFDTVAEVIDTITHCGKKLKLANSTSLDYRNCAAIKVFSAVKFDPQCFANLQPFVYFFCRYLPPGGIDEFLFLASLQAFLKSETFRQSFTFSERYSSPSFEPEIDRSPVQSFLSFYSFFTPDNLPPFQLSSLFHQSSIRKKWSVIICNKTELYSSPLPTFHLSHVEFAFDQSISISVVCVLNYRSICQHFESIPMSNESSAVLHVVPPFVFITNANKCYKIALLSASVFLFLKIRSQTNQIIRFRLCEESQAWQGDHLSVSSTFSPFENVPFPMGSLFTGAFEQWLAGIARNSFWKDIYLQMLPEVNLELSQLVQLVHSVLCDSVPPREILKVDLGAAGASRVSLPRILGRVDAVKFIDEFLAEFGRLVGDAERHYVWRNNLVVYQVVPNQLCSRCVVFGKTLLVFGAIPEPAALEEPAAALPIGQLARSGIELVQFARNAVEVIVALKQLNKLAVVKQIVNDAISKGSIVFTSPHVRTVDDFLQNIT
jgi:hypothetical protein